MSYSKVILIHPAKDNEHEKYLICKCLLTLVKGQEEEKEGKIVYFQVVLTLQFTRLSQVSYGKCSSNLLKFRAKALLSNP